jgi:hypothetical protein
MIKSHLSRSKRRVGESRSSPKKRTTANVKPTTSEPIGVSGNLSPSNLLEQLKNQMPPSKSDPIYQRYINRIDHNKEYCDHVVMDEKYYASDINSMKSNLQKCLTTTITLKLCTIAVAVELIKCLP